jgi:hypothetical protein
MRFRDFSDAFLDVYLAAEGEDVLACVEGARRRMTRPIGQSRKPGASWPVRATYSR